MKKKDRKEFVNRITSLLLAGGATRLENKFYDFSLPTRAGILYLTVEENHTTGPGTVFCRFDKPAKAKELAGCNPYSGKWNHYYFHGTVNYAVNDFQAMLSIVSTAPAGGPS